MGRTFLEVKNFIKGTSLGRLARNAWQARSFTRENAKKVYEAHKELFEAELRDEIINDMLIEAKRYSFGFEEYFMYHFYDISKRERRTFVSDRERIGYCERMNNINNMIIFDDKSLTYKYYKKYYHRDLVGVIKGGEHSKKEFEHFFSKHPKFIVKPFDGACGIGIKIVDCTDKDYRQVFNKLLREYPEGFVVEELIIQSKEMAKLHPQSVNTLRITTIRFENRVDIIHPFMRCGRGDAVVDNGGSGGIICALDVDTGSVVGAADETGIDYIRHPDTNQLLVGFTVPKWEEAVAMVKELANVLPEQRYMGWDLALTDNGWVMQEANDRGAFVGFQLPIHKGFREEIENIVAELEV